MNVSSYICFYHLKCHGVVLCVLTVHLTQWLLTDNYHTRKLIQFLLSCSQTTQPSTTTINDKSDWFLLQLLTKTKKENLYFSPSIAFLTEGLITTHTAPLELDSPVRNQRTPLNSDKTNTFDPATEYWL